MTLTDIVNSEDKRSSRVGQLAAALAATGAVPVGVANGSLILQYDPVVGDTFKSLNLELTNNDQGAVYDSATLSLSSPLAQALWNTVPANQANYANIGEMVADWNVLIRPPPSGQIYNGWNRTVNADGSIDLTNLGQIGGIPDDDYTTWKDSIGFPNQNTMALTVQIPLTQLELDGETGYNPATDARIELNPSQTIENAFVGFTSGGAGSSADGQAYGLIPEATTMALMTVGLAGAYIGRKIMLAKENASKYMHGRKD
jgi:hypothetical protein